MYKIKSLKYFIPLAIWLAVVSCAPEIKPLASSTPVPESFNASKDTTNISSIPWRRFFTDKNLTDLIDVALKNNQELMITLQEIEIAKSEVKVRKGAQLPTVEYGAGIGVEKVGRYTSTGAGDAATDITPGKPVPDALMNYGLGLSANWEVDIWKKLSNSKKAAVSRYLSSIEGKNFVLTNLIAEVTDSYYELLSLDSQLDIVRQNIKLQENALEVVKIQKEGARATELAVQKFQAEVFASKSLEFETLQRIKESENRINFLLGRYPQEIKRDGSNFLSLEPAVVHAGIPSQILANRPDIKQAEMELTAAKLDVKVARAEFYPSFNISATIGFNAFNPSFLFNFPESIIYSLIGDVAGPLINKNAVKAEYAKANAQQLQALYNYERTILNAYLEVATQLSNIENLEKSYGLKSQQVNSLNKAIDFSNDLFKSARVDYFEVLMTQRDALESKLDLVETKKEQMNAVVHVYRDLGGGWK